MPSFGKCKKHSSQTSVSCIFCMSDKEFKERQENPYFAKRCKETLQQMEKTRDWYDKEIRRMRRLMGS